MLFCCVWTLSLALSCVLGQEVAVNFTVDCEVNGNLTLRAVYNGTGIVTHVEWYYSRKISSNLLIIASTCTSFGTPDSGYPPTSRMIYQCPSNGLEANTFQLIVTNVTEQEINSTWGAIFRIQSAPAISLVKIDSSTYECPDCSCKCVCKDCKICHIPSAITIAIKALLIIVAICLIVHGRIERFGQPVCHGLNWFDIIFIVIDVFCTTYGVVAAVVSLIVLYVKNCTDCPCDCNGSCSCNDCKACLGLPITALILAALINTILIIILIYKRRGWCGERLTCLNTVLPVCKDTEARGRPDGKSDHPAVKEKHREVKLLTHKEQTQQHHKETVVNKGKPSGEKHEELSKGQPRPLPVPTGNNRDDTGSAGAVSRQDVVLDRRPMPEIPSDRHKRGLSANFNDDHDKPLDDNIVHTLPVVKKPKTALDPMNAEDQSKNADDQPKKKKKKKKDRDTSRSEEMEDGY